MGSAVLSSHCTQCTPDFTGIQGVSRDLLLYTPGTVKGLKATVPKRYLKLCMKRYLKHCMKRYLKLRAQAH